MRKLRINIFGKGKRAVSMLQLNSLFRIFLLSVLFCGVSMSLRAEKDLSFIQKSDSLLQVLSKMKKANDKIAILRSLATLNRDNPKEISYLKQLFEAANQVDSISSSYEAVYGLTRRYSNDYQLDSLLYWVNYMDSLTNVRNEIPKELLAVHNALCRLYLNNKEYVLAMNEAVKQQILAEKIDYKLGFVYSNENLGLVYMSTERLKDAASVFESCMEMLKEMRYPAYELQVGECLIRTYLLLSEYEKAESLLDYYEKKLEGIEMGTDTKDRVYPSNEARTILYSYRIQLYSGKNEPEKAKQAIDSLRTYVRYRRVSYISTIYNYAMACYYYMLKDYGQALHYINGPTDVENYVFELKVKILQKLGRKKEALQVYKQALDNAKNGNRTAYVRQIDQLRTIQTLNEEEKNKQNIHRQQLQLKNQTVQALVLGLFTIILLASLMFLVHYLIHTKKLKNILLQEKQSLKKTHENLRVAKERAEKAERTKSNFVANISHEIRTPLNAIVGFSDLLSDSTSEERSEYIKVINNNSDLLLNLVSDVLDLSNLEMDDFALNFETVNIYYCCQHALNTVRQRVAPAVNLTFTHPETHFSMITDPIRVQQLLVNLLSNATKFTEVGEINLNYEVDETKKEVIFTVTDTGCGIPEDKQKIIFNRFEKLNDFKQGAGLGLSICMSISDRLHGRLFVDPAYHGGTRFVFVLPFSD